MKRKAVFFDRDGCLIIDKDYLASPEGIEYFNDTFSALKKLQDQGFLLFIITNQSGIGRGFFTIEQMQKVHEKMLEDFKQNNIEISHIAYCPHSPEQLCNCRKPSPLLINEICEKFQIDKSKSFMIGDKISDAQCGENANITGCLIFNSDQKYKSFENLTQFSNYILKQH